MADDQPPPGMTPEEEYKFHIDAIHRDFLVYQAIDEILLGVTIMRQLNARGSPRRRWPKPALVKALRQHLPRDLALLSAQFARRDAVLVDPWENAWLTQDDDGTYRLLNGQRVTINKYGQVETRTRTYEFPHAGFRMRQAGLDPPEAVNACAATDILAQAFQ